MKFFNLTEEGVASFLTSLGAVLVPMLMLEFALVIDAAILVFTAFPDVSNWIKVPASVLLGFALGFTLLITSVNSNIMKKWIPIFFGICTVIMSTFFFELFLTLNEHWSWYASGGFLCILFGFVQYLYADLAVKKIDERLDKNKLKADYDKLTMSHDKLMGEHDKLKSNHFELNEMHDELTKAHDELRKELICSYCGNESDTISKNKRHQSNCEKHPKNLNNHEHTIQQLD